jgi:acyl-CoA dehydrogenase
MSETRILLAETCERLFADLVTPELMRAAEAGEWPAELWAALEENGLTRALVPEDQGGAGLSWQDASAVLFAAGYHAVPAPLAETVVAGWFLARAGLDLPEGAITLADDGELTAAGAAVSGGLERVPWGGAADYVLAEAGMGDRPQLVLLAHDAVERDRNIGRDPRDALTFDHAEPVAAAEFPQGMPAEAIRRYGALARALQMAGAAAAVLDMCGRYAAERVQFGRPLAKFQAIQHQLAILATEAAAAQTAARFACRAADMAASNAPAVRAIASAKIRAGEAAGKAAAIGHQVHGAIGFTDEYQLHCLTRRLWAWRAEFGAESLWAARLGADVAARGAEHLWTDIAANA